MASRKGKAVSSSTFLDLRAEIAKHEDSFARNKANGKPAVGRTPAEEKKKPVWARQNKGVKSRAARDAQLEAVARPTLDAARAALERKAKIYDKLKQGKTGGLSEAQYDGLLVDFDAKDDRYEPDSDDEDESRVVPVPPKLDEMVEYQDEFGRTRTGHRSEVPGNAVSSTSTQAHDAIDDIYDPMVEYEDEFGRVRTVRRSEVPRQFQQRAVHDDEVPEDDPDVVYNPVGHFPIYQPSNERVAAVEAELAEANKPLNQHYDADREVRARGAGFYQFSGDAEERAKQMADLAAARTATEKNRQEHGAVDLRPGEMEGFGNDAPADNEAAKTMEANSSSKSKAMEKRKREIEERRKALDAKRRKVKGLPAVEKPVLPPSQVPSTLLAGSALDPFAALGQNSKLSQADVFLAELSKDMASRTY